MVDVAFLLLIYFIVTTTLKPQEADLGLTLPGMTEMQSDPIKVDQMLIHIDPAGAVLVNDEVTDAAGSSGDLPELFDRLQRYSASVALAETEPMVILSCSDEVAEQRFIDVLNCCAAVGIKNISIAP